MTLRWPLFVLALTCLTCREVPSRLQGWLAGCDEVGAGPVCVIASPPATLKVFVPEANAPVTVELDGEPLHFDLRTGPEGVELQLEVSRHGDLWVQTGAATYALDIRELGPSLPEAVETSSAARTALAKGDWRTAADLLERSMLAHADQGALSRAVRDAHAAAFVLSVHGFAWDEAERRLERARAWLGLDRKLWALHPYYEGLAAFRASEPSRAAERYEEARQRLVELGELAFAAGVDEQLAVTYEKLGRHEQADAVVQRVLDGRTDSGCARARSLSNVAFAGLLAAESRGEAPSRAALEAAEAALRGYARPSCAGTPGQDLARLHASLLLLAAGQIEAARSVEAWMGPSSDRLDERLWRSLLKARLRSARGDETAASNGLQRTRAELEAASGGATAPAMWPEAMGRIEFELARLHTAAGRFDAARAAHVRAERFFDAALHRIPFGEGRLLFARSAQRFAFEHARLRLAARDPAGALCVLRRSRSRSMLAANARARLERLEANERVRFETHMAEFRRLRSDLETLLASSWRLAESERAELEAHLRQGRSLAETELQAALRILEQPSEPIACDALPGPGPGELDLHVFPTTQGVLLGLVKERASTVLDLASPDPVDWWRAADAWLEQASRVRIFDGPGTPDGLHAALWRGRPLATVRPLEFGLDTPQNEATPSAPPRPGRALLVSDAGRNLAGARTEAEGVQRALEQAGWYVARMDGADAEPEPVRRELRKADLFHYAGHGGTEGPWRGEIELFGGSLDAGELFGTPAPTMVVLSGCRTGLAEASDGSERLGLAQAFLLAGSRVVVGATRDMSDALAARAGARLIGDWAQHGDAAAAMMAFAREEYELGHMDWSALRVWSAGRKRETR